MECYAGIEGRNCLIRGCNSDPDTGAVPRLNYERWTWKNLEFNAEAISWFIDDLRGSVCTVAGTQWPILDRHNPVYGNL